jgi:hypothetical protein
VDRYLARQSQASIDAAGDDAEARARAEVEAIRKSETSPGVLLASGYIAGGALAGVAVAFLEFVPSVKNAINLSKVSAGLGQVSPEFSVADIVSLVLFAGLMVFAFLVGIGLLFKPAEDNGAGTAATPNQS